MATFSTPRRSTRLAYQPIVSSPTKDVDVSNYSWTRMRPLFSRSMDSNLDLLPGDREELEKLDEDEIKGLETRFYDAFKVRSPKKSGKGRRSSGASYTTYSIGDTVLVKSENRLPSIAVIVEMWETDLDCAETEKMRVRVHWFDRPSELPSIRAKRYHHDNEIYYTISGTAILYPSAIISSCTVKKGEAQAERARTGRYIIRSEAEADQEFQCLFAVDTRRGIFYEFDWPVHREQALDARDDMSDSDSAAGRVWDVMIKSEHKRGKSAHKSASPRKRVKVSEEEETPRPTPKRPLRKIVTPKISPSKPARRLVIVKKVTSKKPLSRDQESESEEEHWEHLSKKPSRSMNKQVKTALAEPLSDDNGSSGPEEEEVYEPSDTEEDADESDGVVSEPEPSSEEDDDGYDDEFDSPSRKRKRAAVTSTPSKSRGRSVAQPTPHSKKALSRRNQSITGSPSKKRTLPLKSQNTYAAHDSALRNLSEDPWLRAMHALHVGSRPDALPCREAEFEQVHKAVAQLLEEGSGGCIYISGVPGTGKTATVHAVIRELKRLAENNEVNPFTYCEINGLRIPEPSAAYTLLWEVVSGHNVAKDGHLKMSAKESLKSLTRHFSGGGGRGRGSGSHACVVLMDELDQVITAKQDVVYNFFNWPTIAGSKLVVIAVANTMDLPERMTGRVRSRLGMQRINFEPYKTKQLEEIVKARLDSANDSLPSSKAMELLTPDAVKFIAMKISSISGDARRTLDVCRRTIELMRPKGVAARTNDVKDVIKEMQNSPTAAYLRECSLHERIMLASLIKCIIRQGIEAIKVGDLREQHLNYVDSLTADGEPTRKPSTNELRMVLESLVASRVIFLEEGTAAMRKAEAERKVVFNLDQSEVENALFEINDTWKQKLGLS
ncbi:hypothetical protein GYMLUDRAFT_86567 [Collybiopsis luxurians FD-317 M1]|uniref:Origin recognition complex subunit 1 n=1 Tax=Collybiopsis luxurians FD-317 M1 TaxID=944289 RepID=A0A0D0C5A0_9AGAR|nr:hypothetical protein GYMLUDRAFT_86567 [Collybiopsis luxurians FD-317 M1]